MECRNKLFTHSLALPCLSIYMILCFPFFSVHVALVSVLHLERLVSWCHIHVRIEGVKRQGSQEGRVVENALNVRKGEENYVGNMNCSFPVCDMMPGGESQTSRKAPKEK